MTQWSNQHTALVPTIASFEQRSDFDAKEISGATDPMMGVATSSSESGLAVQTRIRQGMNTLMEQMENLDTCKKNTLEMAVSNMQQYYSVDKIQRIIGAEFEAVEPEEQMQVNQIISKLKWLLRKIRLCLASRKKSTSRILKKRIISNRAEKPELSQLHSIRRLTICSGVRLSSTAPLSTATLGIP